MYYKTCPTCCVPGKKDTCPKKDIPKEGGGRGGALGEEEEEEEEAAEER